jgi:CRP-like cAMP-binding protein
MGAIMESFKSGEIITKEGSTENHIFILQEGVVGVFKGDLQLAKFSKKGTVVGEMGTILNHARTATIKALSDSKVEVIKFDLDKMIEERPELTKQILIGLANRLMETTEYYWQLAEITPIDNELY